MFDVFVLISSCQHIKLNIRYQIGRVYTNGGSKSSYMANQ